MTQDIRSPLSKIFIGWLVIGNALWWWGPTALQLFLGEGLLWSTIVPLGCIAALNPRRSFGTLLGGLVGAPLWLINLANRFAQPRRRSQATPL